MQPLESQEDTDLSVAPSDQALATNQKWINVCKNPKLQDACRDFHALLCIVGNKPTHFNQLMADVPGFVGFCNTLGKGARVVWIPPLGDGNPTRPHRVVSTVATRHYGSHILVIKPNRAYHQL